MGKRLIMDVAVLRQKMIGESMGSNQDGKGNGGDG